MTSELKARCLKPSQAIFETTHLLLDHLEFNIERFVQFHETVDVIRETIDPLFQRNPLLGNLPFEIAHFEFEPVLRAFEALVDLLEALVDLQEPLIDLREAAVHPLKARTDQAIEAG